MVVDHGVDQDVGIEGVHGAAIDSLRLAAGTRGLHLGKQSVGPVL